MIKWYIVVGTLSIVGTTAALAFLAVNEPTRMEQFTQAFHARQIEEGAKLYESNCASCHGLDGRGIEGVAPALRAADLFDGSRLEEVGFTGSVEDYVRLTIAAGRPRPSAGTNYPNRMPTWSQRYGGPLRDDQIEALVAFVMNWEEQALAEAQETPTAPPAETVGTDITVSLPEGDPARGEQLAQSLGCTGCHVLSAVGPPWAGDGGLPPMAERAAQRIAQADYTGQATTPEQYLLESIVLPNAYVVEGYAEGVMPGNYGERLSPQDAADLIAYLMEAFK